MQQFFRLWVVAFLICIGVIVWGTTMRVPLIIAQSGLELFVDCAVAAAICAAIGVRAAPLLAVSASEQAEGNDIEFDMVEDQG